VPGGAILDERTGSMLNALKVDPDRAMLLVIDMQTVLLPHIEGSDEVLVAASRLVRGAHLFEIPIMATVQYAKGLGHTHDIVAGPLADANVEVMEKSTFSVCADDPMKARLAEIDRPQVIVTGIEGHVCVSQTVLDLLAMDCQVFVCADAVGSRRDLDLDIALTRMQQAGAHITTVEAVLFELCHISGTDQFKKLLAIVK
jgi:isochorismate hydrolase